MEIDSGGIEAPYRQLAAILRERITSGQIPVGRKIPSQMELEQESGLSRSTVKKALDVLKEEGLIVSSPGRGMYVTDGGADRS